MKTVTTQTLVADRLTPVAAYAALRRADNGPSFLLESVVSGERWGRYSILGYRPRREVVLHAPAVGQTLASGDPFCFGVGVTLGDDSHGIDSVVKMKSINADVFIDITGPKFAAQAIRKAAEIGIMSGGIPEQYGGAGLDKVATTVRAPAN